MRHHQVSAILIFKVSMTDISDGQKIILYLDHYVPGVITLYSFKYFNTIKID